MIIIIGGTDSRACVRDNENERASRELSPTACSIMV